MKHVLSLLLFALLLMPAWMQAQQITNIQASLDPFDRTIDITYDMTARQGKYDKYTVDLYFSQDGGITLKGPLKYIDGDLGEGIRPGKGKIATWDCLEEYPSFDGKNVTFKLVANIDVKFREDRLLKLGGADKALLSLLLPGLGDYKVREGKGYWAIGAVAVGMMGTGIAFKIGANKKYKQYKASETLTDVQNNYTAANNQRRNYIYLTRAAAAIWLTDIALVAIRGTRNQQIQRKIRSKRTQTGFQFHYDPVFQSTSIGFQYKF
ncbi:hypothetical protein GXP67_03720 [Rhodocytophaga rosea]|uniref:DUF5683 domain-containing protein n=1 Tax=Rhodocytophaga rosea TaxID=2704465 RepID=A0A6C0GCZ8_9BACT|nr:hypothetical protein [Rhodocytophaga rosea]QHT65835.1 hypothetical protein GXP67_03720 [Rhodocytophaga rosea]